MKTKDRRSYDREYGRQYRQREDSKLKFMEWRMINVYGITFETYNQLLQLQDESCSICGVHQTELKKRLCVDHCHTTSEVRGLLCSNCNTALGKFKDDIKLLTKAIKYLQQHQDR